MTGKPAVGVFLWKPFRVSPTGARPGDGIQPSRLSLSEALSLTSLAAAGSRPHPETLWK